MIDISKLIYRLYLLTETGARINVTDITESLTWEENDGEMAMHLSATLANTMIGGVRVSSLAKPGCYLICMACIGGTQSEVARCRISEWEPTRTGTGDSVSLAGYDELHDLMESQDNVYICAGTTTDVAVLSVLSKWGVPVGAYQGPVVEHAKTTYKNEYLSDIILDLLNTVVEHGGERWIIRATSGVISILPKGYNPTIWSFEEGHNLTMTRYSMSTGDIATVVNVVAPDAGDQRQKLEAVVTGHVEYGRHERIYVRDAEDSTATATSTAQTILEDEGEPEISFSVKAPDVPFIRKGDRVRIVSRVRTGYFIVKSVQHDAGKRSMTLDLDASTPAVKAATPTQSSGKSGGSGRSSGSTASGKSGGYAGSGDGRINADAIS